jgi:hypothetical protein
VILHYTLCHADCEGYGWDQKNESKSFVLKDAIIWYDLCGHQDYEYMLMLEYKCILASSFAGWRKCFGNFTGCFRSFLPSWTFSQW